MSAGRKQKQKRCHRYNDPGHAHALTFSCFHGQPFLARVRCCEWLADAIELSRIKHDFDVWAYVFMPEHVHLLINPKPRAYDISKILATIKQSVSRRAVHHFKQTSPEFLQRMLDEQPNGRRHYRFWQRGGGFDRNATEIKTLLSEIDYIHANPVRRGLCERTRDWRWSSACAYDLNDGDAGIVHVALDSLPMVHPTDIDG